MLLRGGQRRRPGRRLGRRPRGRGRLLWAVVATVVVAALLGWLVWFSPLLVVRHVEVEGARPGQAGPVRHAAQVPAGQTMAGVDLPAVVGRVLASGDITTTTVTRSWPSTIVIHVTPRSPVMVLRNPQGQPQVVDRYGVPYRSVAHVPQRLRHLPTLTLDGVTGDDVHTALRAAADALETLPAGMRHRVDAVSVQNREDVSFDLGRVAVHWGVGGDGRLKTEVLHTLLTSPGTRISAGIPSSGPVTIDVSAPGEPVVRAGSS